MALLMTAKYVQNTYEMVSALVQSNKQFDLFIYPDKKPRHIWRKYTSTPISNDDRLYFKEFISR